MKKLGAWSSIMMKPVNINHVTYFLISEKIMFLKSAKYEFNMNILYIPF